MVSATTDGVTVTVIASYQPEFSSPYQKHYVFTYKVKIENNSPFTIQLLTRRWEIHDAGDEFKIVEGDGVVGQQPVLEPGESHEYISGCNLKSGLGKMRGSYTMEKIQDGSRFRVTIPEFQLIAQIFNN
ncbi:Co2+/Mg2+ efflux protein ApaG [Belliella kenyensis]|uniref:Co2+/Mg2+ efflux protein ApaG n=1 Tax=Belliella kenyensis TaxID=1472724 RepID=A0ABV8EF72_9BACT|nr:Co2+/Mg2+ efflux protein ApaG [Belliella kenyensis]MCH7401775.1 Co2+/Mg2+ efflux protein ApaG [Belliella kenyensis]MDN3604274.1 Co2+/Mg2+ efflux protein ApaG [Belliella kenyensis]